MITDDICKSGIKVLSRYELQQLALDLETYTEDDRNNLSHPSSPLLEGQLPYEVVAEFSKWIQSPESKTIWVQGIPPLSGKSALSVAAKQVRDHSLKLGIPCISYFFTPRHDVSSASREHIDQKNSKCIAMLYSVIFQLIQLLPHDFEAAHNGEFGETQFQLLDGTLSSANLALKMIDTLLDHATPTLICVIDGIQWAESPTTVPYLQSFIDILRVQQAHRICKICFTTQGRSTALVDSVDVRERVDASRMAQGRPGSVLRGASSVHELSHSISRNSI